MISANGLTRRFGERTVVDDVSFGVERGEIVALLGPNGAGKTTTMRMLAGLIEPTAGTVTIDGVAMTRATATGLRARIGFLTETPGLWERLTVRENLRIYARLYGLTAPDLTIDQAIDLFELRDHASARAAELSKGMRQKVALASALLHSPGVLLLDEPTSGLDPEIRRSVRTLFEQRRADGCAILISTHNLDEAERIADRVAVLDRRLLALDRTQALRQRLTTGRLLVRVAGDASAWLSTARTFDSSAHVDSGLLVIMLGDADVETPRLVSALVEGGANILEVRPEMPALEDVYLHLMDGRS